MAELALLKPDFESKIYPRAVDLKRHPCLCGDLSLHRIVFASRPLKAAISPAYEALRALLSALLLRFGVARELEAFSGRLCGGCRFIADLVRIKPR